MSELRREAPRGHSDESAFCNFLGAVFERKAGELTASLMPMAIDISMQGERLNEVSHSINALKETLREELAASAGQNYDRFTNSVLAMTASKEELKESLAAYCDTVSTFSRTVTHPEGTLHGQFAFARTRNDLPHITDSIEEIKTEIKEIDARISDKISDLLRHIELQKARITFFVKGINSLHCTAARSGSAWYVSEKVYLRGYCISPCLNFIGNKGPMKLHVAYTLHKGKLDAFVKWSFESTIRMSVIHPQKGEERTQQHKPLRCKPSNQMPTREKNIGTYFIKSFFSLDELISDGYIEGDQLRIRCELLA